MSYIWKTDIPKGISVFFIVYLKPRHIYQKQILVFSRSVEFTWWETNVKIKETN